ncbi:MAG: class I SAM-dependent methyltransferase [Candidatus Omnitrophica bacterium]|nr:class I SAM-dependent methyltransferase [Candidatus Omnitrophota bacterium]MCB9768572.1 class I SAM-dependent methyltransferase [Candidatus Omnitrophota bacterium]MCB9784166.1 class I SAM-dependent methyltransferase [Candidatus Omnitrophota bacterium]
MPPINGQRARFEDIYTRNRPPWDIGEPQPAFVKAADEVRGVVLDVGCGTGENALFFADRGHEALGIDFLEAPIYAAKQKAIQRGIDAAFEVQDALSLQDLDRRFDTIIDCGLFHTFSDEDRPKYVASLAKVTNPDGRILLLCFSENEPEGQGPRRVTQAEIHDNFSDGWEVESIEPARFKTRTDIEGVSFSEGGPHAWFAKIRRD